MVTLKDVARDAGVSIATVSCCLSGAKNVRPETRMKVMDSIERLKYVPNMAARNLKATGSRRIGVILTDIDNVSHAEIFKGISTVIQENGYDLGTAFSNGFPDLECRCISDFVSQNVSGIILVTSQPENTALFSRVKDEYHIPLVFAERRPEKAGFDFAGFDEEETGRHITEKLLEKGWRNIAVMGGERRFSPEAEMFRGYEEALKNAGIPVRMDWIRTTDMTKEEAFKEFFRLPGVRKLDAVIATSENIACGIAEACRVQGIRFPEDMRIIALGEETWMRASQIPGVSYIFRSSFRMGTEAARLLMKRLGKKAGAGHGMDMTADGRDINSGREGGGVYTAEAEQEDKAGILRRKEKSGSMGVKGRGKSLRILMADVSTSRSVRLLSENFTAQTGIPVEIELAAQEETFVRITEDAGLSRPAYDVYMYDIPWLEYMVQNEIVADISRFAGENPDIFGRIFPHNSENCRYEGRYYGIPVVGGAQIMFYRKDLFERHDLRKQYGKRTDRALEPPETWEEFNDLAAFFTQRFNPSSPTAYGTSAAGNVDEALAPEILIRIWAHGGRIWDRYNRASLDLPENETGYASLLETLKYTERPLSETSIGQTVEDFCSGRTAMLITYTEYSNRIRKVLHDNISGRVGYSLIPGKASISTGWNLGLSPYTKMESEAFQYFRWLCGRDISVYTTILDGQSPMKEPYRSPELLKLYPWLGLTEESFAYCRRRRGPYRKRSLVIPANRIEEILCRAFRNVEEGRDTLRGALDKGQKEMKELFKMYGYPSAVH